MTQDIIANNENIHINDKQIAILKEHFPSCFSGDGSFDIVRFQEEIKDKTEITHEGYELRFLGKSYAKLLASTDTTTVIVPNEEHNNLPENKDSENLYISGDNLDGLKHLLNSYQKQIKCIYIDPPYNTGTDGFVYNDSFDYTVEELQDKLSIDENQAKRILDLSRRGSASHSAWLMFMYPRLLLARDLLKDEGVIFISIDDNEQSNLKLLCDDIFGEENFVATFPWRKRTAKSDVPFGVSQDFEWVVCYSKKTFLAGLPIARKYYQTPDFPNDKWRLSDLTTQKVEADRPNSAFDLIDPKTKKVYPYNPKRLWGITKDTFSTYYEKGKIVFPDDYEFLNTSIPSYRVFESEDKQKAQKKYGSITAIKSASTVFPKDVGMTEDGNKEFSALFSVKIFSFPKPTSLIIHLLSLINDKDLIVLDFFSGSGTSAHSVLQLNASDGGTRKFISLQLPELLSPDDDSQKIAHQFLKENNYPTTLDYVGIERIKRAAAKIKEENPDKVLDLGFKHFILQEPNQNTLDKCETFDKAALISDATILDDFGPETVLTTWLNNDGYGLTANAEEIDLAGYKAYYKDKHLYLIYPDFTQEALEALLSKYDADGAFNPENIILFGYSFSEWSVTEMLEKNLKILNDSEKNLKINYAVRY